MLVGLPRRQGTKQQADGQRGERAERHDTAIEGEHDSSGQESWRYQGGRQLHDRRPDADTEHAAKKSQRQALGQKLADNAGPARAQRRPYCELARPDTRADEQQVGHVGATHQQDEADDAEEEE